jgi:RNA-directed DNA polymerase
VVVNEHPNVTRPEYDLLKAILHDATRNGVDAANRAGHPDFRAHLLGRIAWVEQLNPPRGRRLRERFAAISWPAP